MNKKTIRDIRYHNARLLQESVGGQRGMVEITGKSQAQISSIIGANPIKGIGNNLARHIEQAFNKPEGWLDAWNDTLSSDDTVEENQGRYASRMQLSDGQITLLREIIHNVERKNFILTSEQKARLIAGVFSSCVNNGLTADDLSDALIDAARISAI